MTLKVGAIFKENFTCGLKNALRNLVNFHFVKFVLSKAYKVLDEKVLNSYVSWHWKVIQRKANSWEICIFCVMQ